MLRGVIVLFLSSTFLSSTVHGAELWLKVGEARTLPASAEAVVRIGVRQVIRAVDTPNGILIVGLKPGVTSLVIDRKSHLVRVSYAVQKDFALRFRQAVDKMMGLKFYTDQKQFVISGRLLRFADWQHLADVARQSNGEYSFRAHPLPDVAEEAMVVFRELARKNGLPVVRFSAEGELRIHIPKGSTSLRLEVEKIFRPYGVTVEMSGDDLTIAPLVKTRVVLAEVSKSFSQEIGLQWSSEYQAQALNGQGAEKLMITLRALEAQGRAQILASPTLLCRSGGHAQFHAGGEFPIRLVSRTAREVIWKPHGVILNVRPRADFQGAISIEIETEISLLDMANAVDGVPAIKKNRVKSHFDLPGKRTVALSGLLRHEIGRAKEGLPFLTSIPILGALFSSQKFINHQTELVVFVTPEIHSPDHDEPIRMPEGWAKNGF